MTPKSVSILLVLVCLALAISWYVFNKADSDVLSGPYDYELAVNCDLSTTACALDFAPLSLALELSPKGLPSLETLELDLRLSGEARPESILVWFEGRDMEMGRHFFTQVSAENQVWKFRGMIPVCALDSAMVWRLNLVIELDKRRYRLYFDQKSQHK